MDGASAIWPDLPYPTWRETAATLPLWTQIVGKIRLALTPWVNHGWQVPLYVTARGLATSPIPIDSRGDERALRLKPRTVAEADLRARIRAAPLGAAAIA